jgi:hypothetical protein
MHHGPELVPKKTKKQMKKKENVWLKTFAGRWPDRLSGFQHFIIKYSTYYSGDVALTPHCSLSKRCTDPPTAWQPLCPLSLCSNLVVAPVPVAEARWSIFGDLVFLSSPVEPRSKHL